MLVFSYHSTLKRSPFFLSIFPLSPSPLIFCSCKVSNFLSDSYSCNPYVISVYNLACKTSLFLVFWICRIRSVAMMLYLITSFGLAWQRAFWVWIRATVLMKWEFRNADSWLVDLWLSHTKWETFWYVLTNHLSNSSDNNLIQNNGGIRVCGKFPMDQNSALKLNLLIAILLKVQL